MKFHATMDEREIKQAISDHVKGNPGFDHGADVRLDQTAGDRPGEPFVTTAHLTARAYVQGKD
jgi:uncharacterized protein involved in copper resistance